MNNSLNEIKVLDHGFVQLYDCMADDLSVVNAAKVSYGRVAHDMGDGEAKLISFLMRHRHGTPFEHNAFTFHVKLPIFVAREWVRHRIGSFNELSGRYKQLGPEWYEPTVENVRRRVGKPGYYTYERMESSLALDFINDLSDVCNESYRRYEQWLEEGLAPELARLFLHVNHYTEWYWTVNARSLMNFLNLRNADTAQWEIKQYAIAVEEYFMDRMPVTYECFVLNGRIAP